MNIVFTGRALRRAKAIATWWRANRTDAPDLFEQELAHAAERLASEPGAGRVYAIVGGQTLRRVLLPKTEQHIYYAVNASTDTVLIHTIWGARRGRSPKL